MPTESSPDIFKTASTLCQACDSIFDTSNGPIKFDQFDPVNNPWRKHHATLEDLRQAVAHGCFICCSINENFAELLSAGNCGGFTHYNMTQLPPIGYQIKIIITAASERVIFDLQLAKGTGSHAMCQQRRRAARADGAGNRLCTLKIKVVDGAMMFRVHYDDFQVLNGVSYATVTHAWPDIGDWVSGLCLDAESDWHPINILPRGLQEAVVIASAAGVSHVWEANMYPRAGSNLGGNHYSKIYAGAVFNIALPTVKSSEPVFSSVAEYRRAPLVRPTWSPDEILMIYSDNFTDKIEGSPLWSKASFHQTVMLSPCTIYCLEQPWFHCRSGALCSTTIPSGRALSGHIMSAARGLDLKAFNFLEGGAQCGSFGDRVAEMWTAFAAEISKAVSDTHQDRIQIVDATGLMMKTLESPQAPEFNKLIYSDGIWHYPPAITTPSSTSMLAFQLSWRPRLDLPRPASWGKSHRTPVHIPSWSWQSISHPVEFEFLSTTVANATMPQLLLSETVRPMGTIKFAGSSDLVADQPAARLEVRGALLKTGRTTMGKPSGFADEVCTMATQGLGTIQITWDCVEESQLFEAQEDDSTKYCAWPIFVSSHGQFSVEIRGLLLRHMSTAQAMYVRCGWFKYAEFGATKFEDAAEALIKGNKEIFSDFYIE